MWFLIARRGSANILDLFRYLYDSKVACSWPWFLMGRQNLSEVCMSLHEHKLSKAKAIAIVRESSFRKIVTGICLVFCLSVAPARLLADDGVVHRADAVVCQSYSVRRGVILTTSARVSVTAAPSCCYGCTRCVGDRWHQSIYLEQQSCAGENQRGRTRRVHHSARPYRSEPRLF